MPCPFFLPTERTSLCSLPHPERLPLGNAYAGHCTAANFLPDEGTLHDCNLGYAECVHLPPDRKSDAVRFLVRRDPNGLLAICYVFEAGHAPAGQGVLKYDAATGAWSERHPDACVQRMAECCVQSFCKES